MDGKKKKKMNRASETCRTITKYLMFISSELYIEEFRPENASEEITL